MITLNNHGLYTLIFVYQFNRFIRRIASSTMFLNLPIISYLSNYQLAFEKTKIFLTNIAEGDILEIDITVDDITVNDIAAAVNDIWKGLN